MSLNFEQLLNYNILYTNDKDFIHHDILVSLITYAM